MSHYKRGAMVGQGIPRRLGRLSRREKILLLALISMGLYAVGSSK